MFPKQFIPRYLLNLISALILPTRLFNLKRWLYAQAGITVGIGVKLTSECRIFGNGNIVIGDNTWVGIGAEFHVPVPAQITIESNCDIAPSVRFLCGSHRIGTSQRRAGEGFVDNISVGAGSWIGAGCTLLPGVQLGKGSLVAAGAVVTPGHYPDNALLAGIPAKVIKIYPA